MIIVKDDSEYLPQTNSSDIASMSAFFKNEGCRARVEQIKEAIKKIDPKGKSATLSIKCNPETRIPKVTIEDCDDDELFGRLESLFGK